MSMMKDTLDNYFDSPVPSDGQPDKTVANVNPLLKLDQCVLYGTVIARTASALLFHITVKNTEEWFPLSQLGYIKQHPTEYENYKHKLHGKDEIHVAKWLLQKKGLLQKGRH